MAVVNWTEDDRVSRRASKLSDAGLSHLEMRQSWPTKVEAAVGGVRGDAAGYSLRPLLVISGGCYSERRGGAHAVAHDKNESTTAARYGRY